MKLIKILPFFFFLFSLSAENILFIGGSYTEEIKSTLTQLLQKENTGTRVQFISPAGKDLKFHINNVNTMKVINNGDWDKIVLQEDIALSGHPEKSKEFHKTAAEFNKYFRSMKKIPKIYYMIPPAYSKGDKSDEKAFPDYTTMQDLITESCKKAATDNKASFIPIGLSFQALLKKYPDFFPNLYKEDGKTPSEVGSYMAACAVYGTIISGAPVVSIKWFGEVDPENAIEIRLIVKKVIDQHL